MQSHSSITDYLKSENHYYRKAYNFTAGSWCGRETTPWLGHQSNDIQPGTAVWLQYLLEEPSLGSAQSANVTAGQSGGDWWVTGVAVSGQRSSGECGRSSDSLYNTVVVDLLSRRDQTPMLPFSYHQMMTCPCPNLP